ncbi:MAG: hypothetical protein AB7O43_11600 [Hyphomicrobiaceae bacterium]
MGIVRHSQTAIVALAAFAFLLCSAAAAQEVCVECSGPTARYRCSIKDFDKIAKYKASGKLAEFVCVTELARRGRHTSCRAGNDFKGICIGEPRELDAATIGELPKPPPAASSPRPQAPKTAIGPPSPPPPGEPVPPAPPGKSPDKPPQTLEELARDTKLDMSGVSKGVDKAGKAVSGAVKNSWRCLSSLFTDC